MCGIAGIIGFHNAKSNDLIRPLSKIQMDIAFRSESSGQAQRVLPHAGQFSCLSPAMLGFLKHIPPHTDKNRATVSPYKLEVVC